MTLFKTAINKNIISILVICFILIMVYALTDDPTCDVKSQDIKNAAMVFSDKLNITSSLNEMEITGYPRSGWASVHSSTNKFIYDCDLKRIIIFESTDKYQALSVGNISSTAKGLLSENEEEKAFQLIGYYLGQLDMINDNLEIVSIKHDLNTSIWQFVFNNYGNNVYLSIHVPSNKLVYYQEPKGGIIRTGKKRLFNSAVYIDIYNEGWKKLLSTKPIRSKPNTIDIFNEMNCNQSKINNKKTIQCEIYYSEYTESIIKSTSSDVISVNVERDIN